MTEIYRVTVHLDNGTSWVVFRASANTATRTAAKESRGGATATVDRVVIADKEWTPIK